MSLTPRISRLLAAIAASAVCAGSGQAQTLEEAIEIALTRNPELAVAQSRLDAADARLDQARASRLPQVNASGQYSYADIDYGTGAFGFGEQDVEPHSAQITAEQLLFAGGRVNATVNAAKQGLKSNESMLADTRARLTAAVARAYLAVHVADSGVKQREANLTSLKEIQKQTDARFKSGEVARSDVALSEARLAGAEAALARSRSDLSAARFAFERVVGVAPQTLVAGEAPPPTPATLEEALATSKKSSPILAAREQAEAAANEAIKSARAQRFPTVTVGVEASTIRDEFLLGYEADSLAVVARARMPLFAGGRIGAEVREARARAEEAAASRVAAELSVQEEVARAYMLHQASLEARQAALRQEEAARLALDDIRLEVKAGARPTLDGLDAERDLLSARLELDAATAAVVTSAYDLNAAVGGNPPVE